MCPQPGPTCPRPIWESVAGLGLKQYCAIPIIFSRIRVPWFQARHAKRANSAMMSSLTVCKTSTVEKVASWLSGKRSTNFKVGHSWTLSGDSSDYSRISIALLGPSHDHYAYSRASSRLGLDYWYLHAGLSAHWIDTGGRRVCLSLPPACQRPN